MSGLITVDFFIAFIAWRYLGGWLWGLFFLLFTFITPYVGVVLSSVMLYVIKKNMGIQKQFVHMYSLDREFYYHFFPRIYRKFGESSLYEFLENDQIPTQKRIMALNMITKEMTKENIGLIKRLLSSQNDELRLNAFAILERIEKRIYESLELYRHKTDLRSKSILLYLYWELIDFELVDGTIKEKYIKKIEELAHELIEHKEYQKDALYVLLSLGLMRRECLDSYFNRYKLLFDDERLAKLKQKYLFDRIGRCKRAA